MKTVSFDMIAVLLAATVVCFTILLLVIQFNQFNTEQVVEEVQMPLIIPHYSSSQTFTIGVDVPVQSAEPVVQSTDDEQLLHDAEDAVLRLSEQIGELEQELDHIENDIDDEEDADEILDDIDDVEEQAEDVLYNLSKWNNRLVDVEHSYSLQEDLDYLQMQAENILDDCNDLENDAEDLEDSE